MDEQKHRTSRPRLKSVEKDSRDRKGTSGKKKVSPEKEASSSGLRSKSPDKRVSSPESRRRPSDSVKPRAASRLKGNSSLTSLSNSSGALGSVANLHSRPVNAMVLSSARSEAPRAPFEVEEKALQCDIFNRETLVYFLKERLFSDLTLVGADGSEHAVHRIVVARASKWIHKQLTENDSPGAWRLEIPFPDPSLVLPQVIRAMYTGQIEITSDSATAVNTLARHLEIPSLLKQVAQYLTNTVQRHNCVAMLRQAIKLNADDVAQACINVVARNFAMLKENDWSWLSYRHFYALLRAEFFQARAEMDVYELISSYVSAHEDTLSKEEIRALHEETRFRFFTLEQMKATAETPQAPLDLILKGALARLESLERQKGEMQLAGETKQTQKRLAHGLQFPFTPELVFQGIVHFLASSSGLQTSKELAYVNPHEAGLLQVTSSSLERGKLSELVALEPTELWTQPVPASWFCVDFKARRVRPHHYTLRHGRLHRNDFLRHW